MKKIISIITLSIGALLTNSMANANPWWVDVGFGGSASLMGPAAGLDVNYMISPHQLITARAMGSASFNILTSQSYGDAGLLYGLIEKGKYAYVSASAA